MANFLPLQDLRRRGGRNGRHRHIGRLARRRAQWRGCGLQRLHRRTERGADLLERAVRAGALSLQRDMGYRDFDAVQPHQVRKKQAIAARLAAMHDAGLPTPDYPGLRLTAVAATASEAYRKENFEGMRRRLAERKPAEPD